VGRIASGHVVQPNAPGAGSGESAPSPAATGRENCEPMIDVALAALLEERPKRGAEVNDRLLCGALRYVEHPRVMLALHAVKLAAQCGFRRFATRLVLPLPFGQGPIVKRAAPCRRPAQSRCAAYWLDQARFYEPASLRRFLNSAFDAIQKLWVLVGS